METPERLISDTVHDAETAANYIREGRFQRSLALLTAVTSIVSGLEVAYEHYRGSYSRRVMYTPVILSAVLGVAAIAGFLQPPGRAQPASPGRRLSRSLMPGWASIFIFAVYIASPADGVCR